MIKTFEKFTSKSDLRELIVDYLQDFMDHFSTTMNRVEWNGDHTDPPKYEFLLTVTKNNKYSVDIEILPDNSDLLYSKEFEKCKSDLVDKINRRFESTTIIEDGDPSEYMIIKVRRDRVSDMFFEGKENLTVDGIKDYFQEFTDTFDTTYDSRSYIVRIYLVMIFV